MHDIDFQLQHMLQGEFSKGWEISERLQKLGPGNLHPVEGKTQEELWLRHNFNRGWFLLQQGKYSEGCQLLESGRHLNVYGGGHLQTSAPIFNPSTNKIAGKSIIISLEGGYGDEIIHARFASSFKKLGAARVYLAASPELVSVLSSVPGVDGVILRNQAHTVPHDYWIPGFSAGWIAGHEYSDLPNDQYLFANPKSIEIWKAIINSDKPKVGIRWAGNPKFEHQQFRRFPNEFITQLSQYEGLQLYSFQRDDNIENLPENVVDLQHLLISWDDTLAALGNMDLVITSCTSIAHAAAALGKPTWVVTPILPYHTWTHNAPYSDTSPFYKTVRLFRQQKPNLWNETFQGLYRAVEQRFNLPATPLKNHDKEGAIYNISDEFKMAANYSDYLAKILFEQKRFEESLQQNKITLTFINSGHPLVYKNMAQCHYQLGDAENALSVFEKYMNITNSNDKIDIRTYAQYLTRTGKFDEGYKLIKDRQVDSDEKQLDIGWFLHKQGKFKEAMEVTEIGKNGAVWSNKKTPPDCKRWTVESLNNKRLCVVAEAGMGDEIIFSRWLSDLKARGADVFYYTDNSLAQVFARNFKIKLHSPGQEYDLWVPSMSLPALLKSQKPGNSIYLTPNQLHFEKWRSRLPTEFTAVSWTGDKGHVENKFRTLPIDYIAEKYKHQQLVSVNVGADDCPPNVLDLSKEIETWDDTLAILSLAKRAIVTSSSASVAAGALGVETHVFTNVVDYFTWCGAETGSKSDWFSNVTVWRQHKFCEWKSIIDLFIKTVNN